MAVRKKAAKKAPAKKAATKKTATKKTAVKKTAAKKKVAAKKVETVTLRHMAADLAEMHELPKRQTVEILDDMVTLIHKHLKKGARLRIAGLGILQVRKRPARMGRNPATGETIKIKASKKVAFRVAKDLKEAVM